MDIGKWSIWAAVALALSGCGQEASGPEAGPRETASSAPAAKVAGPARHILAFGDSLFAGYGLDRPDQSYPGQLQAALQSEGIDARIANAGVSGDTTAAGLQRLDFTLDSQSQTPDLVILELGGNDLLRGLPPEQTKANLAAMLEKLKARGIPVLLMGMRAPPNGGLEFQRQFDAIYPALAKEYGAKLVPFFMESVYDKPELIQPDHVHPTKDGVAAMVAATKADVAAALPVPANSE